MILTIILLTLLSAMTIILSASLIAATKEVKILKNKNQALKDTLKIIHSKINDNIDKNKIYSLDDKEIGL